MAYGARGHMLIYGVIWSVCVLIGGPIGMHFESRFLARAVTKLLEGGSLKGEKTVCLPMKSQRLGEKQCSL